MSTRESVLSDRRTTSTAGDVLRQVAVISALCFMLIASLVNSGVLGGPSVDELQDGALSAEGSYLAPAGPAFSIWSAIYVGLAAYTIWQALPSQRASSRQRSLGWLIAGSMVLNGLWLVIARFGSLVGTVLAIVGLLIVLAIWFQRAVATRTDGWLDALLIDGVSGLHFGWVTVATVANTAAWLTAIGPPEWELAADVWGIVMLVLVGIIALGIAGAGGWRIAPALAVAWGLSWIAVGRLTGEPHSAAIGITAAIVAAVVLIVTLAGAAVTRAADVRNAGA